MLVFEALSLTLEDGLTGTSHIRLESNVLEQASNRNELNLSRPDDQDADSQRQMDEERSALDIKLKQVFHLTIILTLSIDSFKGGSKSRGSLSAASCSRT